MIKQNYKSIDVLRQEISIYRKALKAVSTLINESDGVAGLHLNGDIAPWEELLEGGRFEEWLLPFSQVVNIDRKT